MELFETDTNIFSNYLLSKFIYNSIFVGYYGNVGQLALIQRKLRTTAFDFNPVG